MAGVCTGSSNSKMQGCPRSQVGSYPEWVPKCAQRAGWNGGCPGAGSLKSNWQRLACDPGRKADPKPAMTERGSVDGIRQNRERWD
eukprot:2357408-Pyramimonas_sp.AAC.1